MFASLVTDISQKIYSDERGYLLKYYDSGSPKQDLGEIFMGFTHAGYVRGIHVQVGSASSKRLIFVVSGAVQTIFVDLRLQSSSFGAIQEFVTEEGKHRIFQVPEGIGHGYQALSDSKVHYVSSQPHDPALDAGVHPLKMGIKWMLPVKGISARDSALPELATYQLQNSFHFRSQT
jgi:dTDP-4-dehydrorhamnose 3,5-epimerase